MELWMYISSIWYKSQAYGSLNTVFYPNRGSWLDISECGAGSRDDVYASLRFQRKSFWVRDDLGREINIQIRPIEVAGLLFFDIEYLAYRNILKPWEVLV